MAKPLRCLTWSGDEAELDRLVADGRLTQGDADAVRLFQEYLIDVHVNGVPQAEAYAKHYPESGQADG